MSSFAAAFHFIAAFLLTVAALGGAVAAVAGPRSVPAGRVARDVFAAGWLLTALGVGLHGAQLVGPQAPQTVALRVGGYVLLLSVIATHSRRFPASFRLMGTLAFLVGSEAAFWLVSGLHTGPSTWLWSLAHSAWLAAGLLALGWLWHVIKTSIQARFVAVFAVLLMVAIVVISGVMTQLFASNIAAEAMRLAAGEGEVQKRLLDSQVQESVSRARQVAELDSVRKAVADRDPVLVDTVKRLQQPGGPFDTSDFMAFFAPSGALLALSATGPDQTENLTPSDALSLAGAQVVQSALARVQAGSVDALGDQKFGLVGAYPVFNPLGFDPPGSPQGLAGAVALGRVIDQRYLSALATTTGRRAFLISRTAVLLATSSKDPSIIPAPPDGAQVFDSGRVIVLRRALGLTEYFSAYVPLQQADGDVIGALVLSQPSTVLDSTRSEVIQTVFLTALAATLIAGALAFVSGARITRPILELNQAAERVRGGDLTVRVQPQGSDEVGVLAGTFDEMTASLRNLTSELTGALEQEEGLRSRLETILYSMADGVVAVDAEGVVVAFNPEAGRILGTPAEDATGRKVNDVLRIKDANGSRMALPIYRLGSGSVRGMAGKTPVAVISQPIQDDSGAATGGVAVLRDLTRELEVEKMKTSFLSNVSHELRTPLTPIKGYSDILRRKQVPRERAIVFLDGIIESAQRLERIVDMLVDFSAMEAGRLTPKKEPLDLDKVTAPMVAGWAMQAPAHKFERKGFSRLPVVELDRKLVPLAIGELVDNAVKFSPKGGKVTLTAELGPAVNGTSELKVSVTDAGIGIGQKELSLISGDFSQVDDSITRAYGGMGLGLAYVRRIAESYGGRLEVASTPNKGSTFSLTFPVSISAKTVRPAKAPRLSARKTK